VSLFEALFDKLDASIVETFKPPELEYMDFAAKLADHTIWLADSTEGQRATFTGKNWGAVDLHGMNLTKADLSHSRLVDAYLINIELADADLYFADFYRADMQDANLSGADLRGARLARANLQDANLRGAYLYETDLRSADLRGADLSNTTTTEADFRKAKLDDVMMNWSSQELIGERLYQAADTVSEYMIACFVARHIGYTWWTIDGLEWAIATMRQWVKHHDDMPDYMRQLLTERS